MIALHIQQDSLDIHHDSHSQIVKTSRYLLRIAPVITMIALRTT